MEDLPNTRKKVSDTFRACITTGNPRASPAFELSLGHLTHLQIVSGVKKLRA